MSVLYPGISPPTFSGPHIEVVTCNATGNETVDFYFQCNVEYKPATDPDTAMFDVALMFDGVVDQSTVKTTDSSAKTVKFYSADFPQGQFGKHVSNEYNRTLPRDTTQCGHIRIFFFGIRKLKSLGYCVSLFVNPKFGGCDTIRLKCI